MLLLLLLPFLLQLLGAKDVPEDTSYVIRKITSCPAIGYYFRREPNPNSIDPGPCYLCFCQNDGTAVCWKRENKRCDSFGYKFLREGKRDRVRRSPFSFSDIFFRDAAQDLTGNVKSKDGGECKPFESTFSDDCPPADWCIGCTVCDCDAKGRWDCHLLSFCPDKNNKTKATKIKKPLKTPKKTTKSTPVKPTQTTTKTAKPQKTTKSPPKPLKRPHRQVQNNKSAQPPYQKSKNIKKNNKPSPKPLIIRKGITRKPTDIKSTEKAYSLKKSDKDFLTQEIMKNVLTIMRRMFNNSKAINNQLLKVLPKPKTIQKRSMNKRKRRNRFKPYKKKSKYNKAVSEKQINTKETNPVPLTAIQRKYTKRYKREIAQTVAITTSTETSKPDQNTTHGEQQQRLFERSAFGNKTTDDDYYKYHVVTEIPASNMTEQQNFRFIYAENYNSSLENEVQQSLKKDNQFNIIPIADIRSKDLLHTENEKVTESKTKLNNYNEVINDKSKQNVIINDDKLKITNTIASMTTTSQTPIIDSKLTSLNYSSTTAKNKVHSKYVTRLVNPHSRKHTTTKIVNTLKHESKNFSNFNRSTPPSSEKSLKARLFKKVADIQNIFKKLLNDFRMRNNYTKTANTKNRPKRKKVNILRYLKKFFRKLFRGRSNKARLTSNSTIERSQLKNHVIEAICEIFDNCVINKNNKKFIETKINQLYTESNNIFRSIKIIKGLLHLIDLNYVLTNSSAKPFFKDDVQKLNYILKNEFKSTDKKLTESQITQIKYIKNNTQVFVQSVGRFANILNEIIAMLTKDVAKNKEDLRNRRNTKTDSSLDSTVTKDFIRLKNILIKYNLVQNNFMKKIYETLNKFENVQDNNTLPQVSYKNLRNLNASLAMELFSRNIIENLRKLRNLAEMLNSRSRRKRQIGGDEDSTEYLLTLMEYMVKQSFPLDAIPVNDGIDLLIDAIKDAPDIKPLRKKILDSMSSPKIRISRTTDASPYRVSDDELLLRDRVAKEDNDTFIPSAVLAETVKHNVDQNKADIFNYQNADENTESVYYVRDFTSSPSDPNDPPETTLPYPTEKKSEEDQKDSNYEDKIVNKISSIKKFEVYSDDIEEDEFNVEVTSTRMAPETEIDDVHKLVETISSVPIVTTDTKLAEVKQKQTGSNESSESAGGSDSDGDKRASFDWLNEVYDQDLKEKENDVQNITLTTPTLVTTTPFTRRKPVSKKEDTPVSSMSREASEEDDKKNQAKWNSEHLMRQKQMDLLNSLDYGTEKSEVEESADPKEEKDDAFPAYFS